jgi:hypothetical protein
MREILKITTSLSIHAVLISLAKDETARPRRFAPGERAPGVHWIGAWVGPRAGLGDMEKRRYLTLMGLELRARSQSLYLLRYPGSSVFHEKFIF